MIRFTGLDRQYKNLREEILEITDRVYSSGQVLDGSYTEEFERQIARRTDRKYAIAVSSCSQALLMTNLYYLTKKIQAGNVANKLIAVPALSFIATAAAPVLSGWEPVFIDVDKNGILDIDKLELRSDNIKMLTYVNLFGNLIDYDKLKLVTDFFDEEVIIVEDAAQSFGASYKGIPSGKLGHASCLSFDPTKNLPNYGSGGMILTDDEHLAGYVRMFRDNGKGASFEILGTNSKMSEVDCAQMSVKLRHFDSWQKRRAEIAQFYNECLFPYVSVPEVTDGNVHAWHKYVIRTVDQLSLQDYLENSGVETKIHYERILPEVRAFSQGTVKWNEAAALTRTNLSLPIYPEMTDAEVQHVVASIQKFYD